MTRALLIVPHFWDPVCVPLGVCSLKAYAECHGHDVDLLDLNTDGSIFRFQHLYFRELCRQFPEWEKWNVERNATEILAQHQILYLDARHRPQYKSMVAEVLNVTDGPLRRVFDKLDVKPFDELFDALFAAVRRAVQHRIARVRPQLVGLSLFNSTWAGSLFIARLVKELDPRIRTMVGGPGPIMGITAEVAQVEAFFAAHDEIDFFIVGEGEQPLVDILDNATRPPGILLGRDYARLKMEDLPTPDYGNLEVDRYLQLSVSSSRGCPFACSFCAETVFWDGFRKTSADLLYENISRLSKDYGRSSFYICDSLSNAVIGPLTDRVARDGKDFLFDCYLRADKSCIDPVKAAAWKRGGLYRARLGMESASQRILDEMVKMTTPTLMSKSLQALASAGVMTSTLWVVGYPGETGAEFNQTLDFIDQHQDQIYQADAWVFQYHNSGLANSSGIEDQFGSRPRFSDDVNKLLHVAPHIVNGDLSAEERFDRLERFVRKMRACDIPNPYALFDWVEAEGRWAKMGRESGWSVERSMAMNG